MPADPPIPLGLPWYFTVVLVTLWLATVTGIVVLLRRRLRLRRANRQHRRRQRAATAISITAAPSGTSVQLSADRWHGSAHSSS